MWLGNQAVRARTWAYNDVCIRRRVFFLYIFFKRNKFSYLERNVREFISDQSKDKDIYTIDKHENFISVINKITENENLEDAVAVIDSTNSEPVISIIADVDALAWVKNVFNSNDSKNLQTYNADEIAKRIDETRDFFWVSHTDTLRNALVHMKKNNVDQVIVLDDNQEYIGWVNKNSIIKKIRTDLLS